MNSWHPVSGGPRHVRGRLLSGRPLALAGAGGIRLAADSGTAPRCGDRSPRPRAGTALPAAGGEAAEDRGAARPVGRAGYPVVDAESPSPGGAGGTLPARAPDVPALQAASAGAAARAGDR